MRHRNTTKTFKRTKSAKEALFRDLATSVIVYDKIKTTEAKAKAVRPIVEKLVTVSKAGDLTARRRLLKFFTTEQPVNKLIEVIGPRYKDRDGGYLRLTKLGIRQGDGAQVVQIEFV